MLRNFTLTLLSLISLSAFAQTTLYTGNFEPPFVDWTFSGDIAPNSWLKDQCAGNGSSQPGTYSLYITPGGTVPGCGASGTEQFAYVNSPSGVKQNIASTTIDGICASNHIATFDYRINGVPGQDYAELVYSTNGGTSWTVVGSSFLASTDWATLSIPLPTSLNFSSYLLGVRFTYDASTVNGFPLAIDNFKVIGTDNVNPIITCPSSITQPVNTSCSAFADDYTKSMVSLSDNCTDSANIIVTQSIIENSIIPVAPGSSTTITLTAVDEAGNSSQCSFTLNIIDDIDPTITSCASNTSIPVNNTCQGILGNYAALTTATDNCSGTLTYTQNPIAGTVVNGSDIVTSVTITVSDQFGNSTTCTMTATTVDTILPVLTCPGTQTLYANTSCNATLANYTGLAVFSDNCVSNSSMGITQSPVAGTTISSDQIITLTLTGGVPSTPRTCQFTVDLIDTIKPTILCPVPSSIFLNTSCVASIPNYTSSAGLSDNCSLPSQIIVTQTPIGGTTTSTSQLITLTATDQSGNSKSCSFTQLVLDTIKPVLTCPGNQTLPMNASCFATLTNYVPLVSSVENCFFTTNTTITQSQAPGTTISGMVNIIMTGTDESGNTGTCSFTVTPIDGIAPTIICPSNTTVNTNSGCTYILPNVSSAVTATDNCTSTSLLTYAQNPIVGTALNIGTHTISVTVTDASSNSTSCSYQITVADQTLPTVFCPGTQTVSAGANCSGTLGNYTALATISDNCTATAQLVLSQSPAPGTVINSNTTVQFTVQDAANNIGTCSFTATLLDDIDPVLTCPNELDVAINSSCQYPVPDMSTLVTGTDNCSSFASMTITQNPVAGSIDNGLTAVLITLTDQQGNSNTCVTLLTPIDTEVPTITCPSPAPINNGSNCTYALANFGTSALVLDNCANYTISQTPAPGTSVQTGTHLIELEVMDAGGNTANCSFNLTVIETVSPTITCPSTISTCDPLVNYTAPSFSDNCAVAMAQTDATGLTSGDIFPIGFTTLTYTATDSSGNSSSCSFQIHVLDFPDTANILVDTLSLCQVTSAVIEADQPVSGTGVWALVSGQVTFNNQFANTTGVNNIGYGTNVLTWTVNSASCGSTTDTLVLITSQQPLPASTQDTIYACNDGIVDLLANVPLYGTGVWTTTPGASIADINDASTTATSMSQGWNEFVWTITNGSCPATSDTLRVYALNDAMINQADTSLCIENGSLALSATPIAPGQTAYWYFIQGSGVLETNFTNTTSVEDLNIGNNSLVYIMKHDVCPDISDTINIVASLCNGFDPVFPTVITPNFDGKNDLFVIDYLEKIYPNCTVTIFNRWGSVVYESIGYTDPWDGTYNGEALPMGAYFYKVELNDPEATVYNGSISIIH